MALTREQAKDKLQQLEAARRVLRKALRGVDRGRTKEEFRADDSIRKREEYAERRHVLIRPCQDLERRTYLEAHTEEWLLWYFPGDPVKAVGFWHPFTEVGKEMIRAIETTIVYGTDQCIAGPRGEGKSSISEAVILKNVLTGVLPFGLIFAANTVKAMQRLHNIKGELEENDRLAADYPEVCDPIRGLEGAHNRVLGQTTSGDVGGQKFSRVRTKMQWAGETIRLPTVPGSRASGVWIGCFGLHTPVRGENIRGARPIHALIDDADTEETGNNEEQARKLEDRIDRAIVGLAPQGKTIGRVMLCTIPSKKAVAWKFSDPQQKPSWKGKRYRLVDKWPDHLEMWEEYTRLRFEDMLPPREDEFGRTAHSYYLANRKQMDAGVVVTNPYRFKAKVLPDGSQEQVSTIQLCYDEILRTSREAFSAEYQSEVIEEHFEQEAFVTSAHIQKRVSGFVKYIVPEGCTVLTQGIDPGKEYLSCVVRAWRPDGTGFTIDYDKVATIGTVHGSDEGLDEAIERALHQRKDFVDSQPYRRPDGTPVGLQLTLIDCKYRGQNIFQFCRKAGPRWMPAEGYGDSSSCVGKRFTAPVRSTMDKRAGCRWYRARQQGTLWVIRLDSNYWIQWEHDHWMRDLEKPGALWLFGIGPNSEEQRRGKLSFDQYHHKTYAMHIVAENWVPELRGGKVVFGFRELRHENHFLDCSKMCDVAAAMSGVEVMGPLIASSGVGRSVSLRDWFGG